jgi:hypothetical protein
MISNIIKLAMNDQLDSETEPSLSMEEINELQAKVDNDEAQILNDFSEIDSTMNVVGALEDLAFIASSEETVTPKEAALIQIAADATMLGTGADASVIFPAMEDISSGSTISARIKEVIKRILAEVARILALIKKKVMEFLTGHKKLAIQRRTQIKKLQSTLSNVDDNKVTGNKFKTKPLYFVNADGDVHICTKVSDMIYQLAQHAEMSEKYLVAASDYISTVVQIVGNFYKAVQAGNMPLTASYASMLASDRTIRDFSRLRNSKKVGTGLEITNGFLSGGVVTVDIGEKTVKDSDGNDQIAATFRDNLSSLKARITTKSTPVNPIEMNAMPRNESSQLLKLGMRLVDLSDKINTILTTRQSDIETLVRVIEKTAQVDSISGDVNSKLPYLNIITSVIRNLEAIPVDSLAGLYSLNSKVINQVIRVVVDDLDATVQTK